METKELTDSQKQTIDGVKEKIEQVINKDFIEEVIKSNVPEFTHEGTIYRIGKATYDEKQRIYKERVKKFTALLKDGEYSLEKDLKKLYLTRGIDIEALTKQITSLDIRKKAIQMRLGELLKNDGNDVSCNTLKKEIEDIQEQQKVIAIEKQSHLEFSIENQVLLHIYNYMTFVIAEKKVGETWVKAFKTFEEFMNQDEELVGKLAFLVTMTSNMTL